MLSAAHARHFRRESIQVPDRSMARPRQLIARGQLTTQARQVCEPALQQCCSAYLAKTSVCAMGWHRPTAQLVADSRSGSRLGVHVCSQPSTLQDTMDRYRQPAAGVLGTHNTPSSSMCSVACSRLCRRSIESLTRSSRLPNSQCSFSQFVHSEYLSSSVPFHRRLWTIWQADRAVV